LFRAAFPGPYCAGGNFLFAIGAKYLIGSASRAGVVNDGVELTDNDPVARSIPMASSPPVESIRKARIRVSVATLRNAPGPSAMTRPRQYPLSFYAHAVFVQQDSVASAPTGFHMLARLAGRPGR
jgi:hypothetical protein